MRCAREPVILWAEMNPTNGVTMMGHERGNGSEACRSIDESQAVQPSVGERRGMVSAGRRRITAYVLAAMVAMVAVPATASAHIYWPHNRAPAGDGAIGRANNDGSAPNPTLITSTGAIGAVAVSGTHIYWTNFTPGGAGSIGRANLDGSDANRNFITGLNSPRGIAVEGAHIYWADWGHRSIGRANLGGSDVHQNFIK